MQTIACSFTTLTNAQLVDEVMALASREREATAQLIAEAAHVGGCRLQPIHGGECGEKISSHHRAVGVRRNLG